LKNVQKKQRQKNKISKKAPSNRNRILQWAAAITTIGILIIAYIYSQPPESLKKAPTVASIEEGKQIYEPV